MNIRTFKNRSSCTFIEFVKASEKHFNIQLLQNSNIIHSTNVSIRDFPGLPQLVATSLKACLLDKLWCSITAHHLCPRNVLQPLNTSS